MTGSEPLGTLAKSELRSERVQVHNRFDVLWKKLGWSRPQAYSWLAKRMGIPESDCHIGSFDMAQCHEAKRALKGVDVLVKGGDEDVAAD